MIHTLKLFCDLIDLKSFTKAGKRNDLTQSAVSQQLKSLEQKLGQRLIERASRRIAPTAAGRTVYDAAQHILWRYRQMERALAAPSTDVTGALRVAASLTVGLYELPAHLAEFLRQYPKVDLRVTYLHPSEVYEAILGGQADVGLVAFPAPHPQLIIQVFKKDRLVVIVPPSHPWAALKRIALKRLHGQPFIAMEAGSPMRQAVDRLFKRANIRVGILHEFDNLELIKRAVEVRSGLSIVPLKTVETEIRAGTVTPLDILDGPIFYPVGILTQRQQERSLAAQKLIAALLAPVASAERSEPTE